MRQASKQNDTFELKTLFMICVCHCIRESRSLLKHGNNRVVRALSVWEKIWVYCFILSGNTFFLGIKSFFITLIIKVHQPSYLNLPRPSQMMVPGLLCQCMVADHLHIFEAPHRGVNWNVSALIYLYCFFWRWCKNNLILPMLNSFFLKVKSRRSQSG